jgi:hypothetical protein
MVYSEELQILVNKYQAIDQALLKKYSRDLIQLQKVYNLIKPEQKKTLTIPSIFRKSYDENFISDYLAYILDPARNGIGSEPLINLLQRVGVDTSFLEFEFVDIQREYVLSSGGRIDFLIKIDQKVVIGIENKIYASEGNHQTVSYATAIKKEFSEFERVLIFLTRVGVAARSSKFTSLSYHDLLEILEQTEVRLRDDFRTYFFWQDFIIHLEDYILMKKSDFELSEKSKLYFNHFTMLRDLEKSFKQDMQEYFDYLAAITVDVLGGKGWQAIFRPSRTYQQIYKESWDTQGLWIHFEYRFSEKVLMMEKFTLMIDVERKQNKEFLDFYREKMYPDVKSEYDALGIEHTPGKRRIALAYKEYLLEPDSDLIDNQIINALKEFSFLIDVVDKALKEFAAKN